MEGQDKYSKAVLDTDAQNAYLLALPAVAQRTFRICL